MRIFGGRLRAAAAVVAGVAAVGATGLGVPAAAAQPAPAGPVSSTPAPGTPELAPTGSTSRSGRSLQCGGTMYAVGKFTAIKQKASRTR